MTNQRTLRELIARRTVFVGVGAAACGLLLPAQTAAAAHPSGAHTDGDFTLELDTTTGNIRLNVRVELRHNSPRWWARATPYWRSTDGTYGGGGNQLGTVKLQKRKRLVGSGSSGWESWSTMKSKSVTLSGGQVWTDDSYNPVNSDTTYDRQIRAAFTDLFGRTSATNAVNI